MAMPNPQIHPDVLRSGGATAIPSAKALVKALIVPDWATRRFEAGNRTRQTLIDFSPCTHFIIVPTIFQLADIAVLYRLFRIKSK